MSAALIVLAVVIGLAAYLAVAVMAFGGATCAGVYAERSDFVWAALWPVYWLRPLSWKVRSWWRDHGPVRRWSGGWQVFTVPTQRIDRWLLRAGEGMSIWWANRNEDEDV